MIETIKTDEIKINKYHNGKIYKLVNDVDDKVYIGSTCQPLYKRLYEHKNDCKKGHYFFHKSTFSFTTFWYKSSYKGKIF
jgi:hypothetical protein